MTITMDDGGVSGCGCEGGNGFALAYRTPADYVRAAKKMQAAGDPRAQQAMRAAALALATARAAQMGNTALAARGLAGLKAMGSLGTATDLDSTLRSLGANPQIRQYVALISSLSELANAVVAIVAQMTGNAADPGVAQALGWMRFITGASATPPGLSEGDIRSLANFVRSTAFLDNADVIDAIMGAVRGVTGLIDSATRSTTASQVTQVVMAVVQFLRLFRSKLAENSRIQAILAAEGGTSQTTPIDPTSCETLVCPSGTSKIPRPDGNGCYCSRAPLAPGVQEVQNYRTAVASRKLVEGILTLPPGRLTAAAERMNCASSCTLLWAMTEVQRVRGSIPAIPGLETQPRPLRYFDARTAPRDCNCTGMRTLLPGGPVFTAEDAGDAGTTSGGGSGVAIAAGAGALALLFLLRG